MFCAQTDRVNKDFTVFCLLQEKKEMDRFRRKWGHFIYGSVIKGGGDILQ